MTPKTVQTLSKINHRFYELSGSKWNPKPNYYWEGWVELLKYLDYLAPKTKIRVLDIGCGNGRFSNFLVECLPIDSNKTIEYIGVDFALPMLDQIENRSYSFVDSSTHTISRQFYQLDIINQSLDELHLDIGSFDLVVAFGLIHHIPSSVLRQQLVENWSLCLASEALMVVTTWDYVRVPRLAKHIMDPEDFVTRAIYQGLDIDMSELEKGDNLLRWVKYMPEGQYTLRYSHSFDNAEIENIFQKANLRVIANYRMDGGKEERNSYWLTKKRR